MGVYKDLEFAEFIRTIESGAVAHWKEIAEALGVEEDTITRWKEMDEAVKARQKGIAHALEQMEYAGKKDWRMWEKKLAMLGVNPPQKIEGDLRIDDRKKILAKYGLGEGSSARQIEEAESRSPSDSA
jgi:hypothetical protein